MAVSAGRVIFILRAASPIAPSKQADQPAANNCSGLVPMSEVPGIESLTSRRPSSLREAPARPPVVWVLAVYITFFCSMVIVDFPLLFGARTHAPLRQGRL